MYLLIRLFWLVSCFFCVLLCVLSRLYAWGRGVLGDLVDLHLSTGCSVVLMWRSRPSSSVISPHSCLSHLSTVWSFMVLFDFDFVFHLTRAYYASPCAHPNSPSPTWVPPYPFMSVHTHMSILGNFPDHKWTEIILWWPIFLVHGFSFCLVFLCASVIAPRRTHLHPPHPSASARALDYIENMCILWS